MGGVKANIGHAEAAAGLTGLLKLINALRAREAAPNAQLRLLNPHVGSSLHGVVCTLPVQLTPIPSHRGGVGGVSSFGYSGTIAHQLLTVGRAGGSGEDKHGSKVRSTIGLSNVRPHPFSSLHRSDSHRFLGLPPRRLNRCR